MVSQIMREHRAVKPTNNELFLLKEEVIVSKTDTAGVITYANPVFCKLAGYPLHQLIGAPHNVIRHPDMPRCVFRLLWERISAGHEIFAFVKNMSRSGDFYWVLAHVTPTYDLNHNIIGYHSNRRSPDQKCVDTIAGIYSQLRAIELASEHKEGIEKSTKALNDLLDSKNMSYDEFIFTLIP